MDQQILSIEWFVNSVFRVDIHLEIDVSFGTIANPQVNKESA